MKKLTLLLTLAVLQFANAQAPAISWQKYYGGPTDDFTHIPALGTADGGYIMIGTTGEINNDNYYGIGNSDVLVIKVDQLGTVQWQKNYGGKDDEYALDIKQTSDGGYIFCSSTKSNDGDVFGNHGANDFWFVKIDAIGTIQWQKCYGGNNEDYIANLITTLDGGYIACGITRSINNGDVLGNSREGSWIIKINNLGVIEWQKVYDTDSAGSDFYKILQTPDKGFVVAGFTGNASLPGFRGGSDIVVAKINQAGTIQWQKCFGGSNSEDYVQAFIATNDGGYIFSSQTDSNDGDVFGNHGGSDCWVVKLDASGSILRQKCFGGSGGEGVGFIQKTLDGGFILSLSTDSNDGNVTASNGSIDACLVKLDFNLNIQWQKSFGGYGEDGGIAQQLKDGTYIITGVTNSNKGDISGNNGTKTFDVFLMKLTAANLANKNFVDNSTKTYPNPTKNILHIDIETALSGQIADLAGKTLMKVNTNDIDVSSLTTGIYLLDIVSEGKRYVSKIIKE